MKLKYEALLSDMFEFVYVHNIVPPTKYTSADSMYFIQNRVMLC